MRSEQHSPTRVRLNIIRVTDPTVLQRIYQFRVQVWLTVPGVQPDTFPDGRWQDAHDAHARHWAIFDENNIVGAARLCIHQDLRDIPDAHLFRDIDVSLPLPIASINRVVVHPRMRGRGLARQLDQARLEQAARLGCRSVVGCWTQVSGERRWRALERQGFRPVNGRILLPDTPFGPSIPLALSPFGSGPLYEPN